MNDLDAAGVSSLAVNDASNPVAIDGSLPRTRGNRLLTERRLVAYPISADRLSVRSADAGRSVQAVNVELHRHGSKSRWGRLPSGRRLLFHECFPPAHDRRRSGADPIVRVLFRTTPVIVRRASERVGFPGVAPCRVSRDGTIVRWRVRSRCRSAPELGGRRFTPRLGRARASGENTYEREQKTEIQSRAVPLSKSLSLLHLVSDTKRPEMFPRIRRPRVTRRDQQQRSTERHAPFRSARGALGGFGGDAPSLPTRLPCSSSAICKFVLGMADLRRTASAPC